MKKAAKPRPGSRAWLTRELVLRAALKIIDERGIETLSMRLLGSRLGVEAMSLYNHVKSKDEILDGVLDLVLEEIVIPAVDANWRSAMHERAVSAWIAFRRHPWASALVDSRLSSGPARLRYFDTMIGTLHRAGFTFELTARALSVLDCYVYGFGRQQLNMSSAGEKDDKKRAEAFRDIIPGESFPYLAQMAEWAAKTGYDEGADFEFGLTLILDGLERLLIAGGRT
jgi:AcrR family transcriptional regulator